MIPFNNKPIPIIDLKKCDGCRFCVRACPTKALSLQAGKAVVSNPQDCEYSGQCEVVCPKQAISRPFEIVIVCDENEGQMPLNSIRGVKCE